MTDFSKYGTPIVNTNQKSSVDFSKYGTAVDNSNVVAEPVKEKKRNRLVLDSAQLQEITLPKHKEQDYYNHVSQDTLWQLYELDGLTLELQKALDFRAMQKKLRQLSMRQ